MATGRARRGNHPGRHAHSPRRLTLPRHRKLLLEPLEQRRLLSGAPPVAVDDAYTTGQDTPLVVDLAEPQEFLLSFDDFEGSVSPGWSSTPTAVTATGDRSFLGQFASEQVSLQLEQLPRHQEVLLEFDLYVIESWDGNLGAGEGPDIWSLDVEGGATLLNTTFTNWDLASFRQAYPDEYPGGDHPTYSGAVEHNTLGYTYAGDAVYHFAYRFSHSADAIQLNFAASGLEGVTDESWGLDNVRVSVSEAFAGVLANDNDPEGDPLTAQLVAGPTHGSLTLNVDGTFEYTPNTGFSGIDTFTYVANDGLADSNEATVTITVNRPPMATDDAYATAQDTPLVVDPAEPEEFLLSFDDFERGVSSGWSDTTTSVTPVGDRTFLGEFSNGQVALNLDEILPHEQVTLEFDLYINKSWDGNSPYYGRDFWRVEVDGGPTLLNTTFDNVNTYGQTYPDSEPGGSYPARTGAAESNTLGYGHHGDAVYHFQYTFDHSADALQLNFIGNGSTDGLEDESWGLDNVRVTVPRWALGVLANDTDTDGNPLTA